MRYVLAFCALYCVYEFVGEQREEDQTPRERDVKSSSKRGSINIEYTKHIQVETKLDSGMSEIFCSMANQLWRGKFQIITQLANYLPKLNGASVLHNPIVHVNDFTKQMPGVPQNISTTHFCLTFQQAVIW